MSFAIDRDDLSFINAGMQRVTEPGEFELLVGDLRARLDYVER